HRDADERDDVGAKALDLLLQDLPALQVFRRLQIVDSRARARDQVRDAEPPFRQADVVFVRDRFGDEARLVEQPPEAIRRTRKVMSGLGRTHARIDADEQDADARLDAIREPEVGPVWFNRHSPMNWLFKEEPTHYSFDDLVRDGKTSWTGVRNP